MEEKKARPKWLTALMIVFFPITGIVALYNLFSRKVNLGITVKTTLIFTLLFGLVLAAYVVFIISSIEHQLTGNTIESTGQYLARLKLTSFILVVLFVVLGAVVGGIASTAMISPVRKMIDTIDSIDAEHLDTRLAPVESRDELYELTDRINDMLDDIQLTLERQSNFVSDASHELKTPLSVIQGYANLLKRWGKDDPEILDEGIENIAREAENMKRIVQQLLLLAKLGNYSMTRTRFKLSEAVQEAVDAYSVMNLPHTITFSGDKDIFVETDKSLLVESVRTLIDKAVRFLDLPAECAREGVKNLYEAYFQSSSLNKLDLVRLFDEDLFKDSNPESFADYSKLYQLRGKLTQLRNSHFYKILSRAPAFTGVPEATNLFVHNPDYNGCFKLWRSLDEFYAGLSLLSSAQQRSVYSAFVTLAMISCYVRLGFAPVRDVPVGNTDKNFSLKDFCLKNEDFNVVLNADEEKITVLVQCAKARSQQTTVIRLRTDLSEEDVSDNAFTVSLHRTEYSDRAVCVTPGNKNSLKDLEALVRCSVLTFGADKNIYDKVCLVCGSNLLEDKGRAFRCPDCGAVYTFLGKDKVWLNQFNALSDMEKK